RHVADGRGSAVRTGDRGRPASDRTVFEVPRIRRFEVPDRSAEGCRRGHDDGRTPHPDAAKDESRYGRNGESVVGRSVPTASNKQISCGTFHTTGYADEPMIKNIIRLASLLACACSIAACTQTPGNGASSAAPKLETEDQKTLYALGLVLGRN